MPRPCVPVEDLTSAGHLSVLAPVNRRLDIEGMRAIAVVAVIVNHADATWLPGGFLGVDLFFVVSGFVITSAVWRHLGTGSFSYVDFMLSRVRRIVPAYMAMLGIVALAMALVLIPTDFVTFRSSLDSAAIFNSNAWFGANYDYFAPAAAESPLLHTWSLAVEMKFYLVLPLLLLLAPRRVAGWLLALLTVGLVAIATAELRDGASQSVYYSLAARAPELLVGSVLAVLLARGELSRRINPLVVSGAGLALIAGSFVLVDDRTPVPGIWTMPLCLGAALMIAAPASPLNERVLAIRPLVAIGGLSYSLYLWHWPVFATWRYVSGAEALTLVPFAAALVVTVVFAYLSKHFIEDPLRHRQIGQHRKVAVRWMGLGTVVVTATVAAILLNPRLVGSLPVEDTRYAAAQEICHGQIIGDCAHGDLESDETVLLIGDSHAAQLNRFADMAGAELGIRFVVVSASSCVPIEGFDVERLPERARAACRSQIAAVTEMLPQFARVLMAGKWTFQSESPAFRTALAAFMEEQELAGRSVLVLAQLAELDRDPRRVDRLRHLGLTFSAHPTPETSAANKAISELVASSGAGRFLDLSRAPLFGSLPYTGGDRGRLIYMDTHHLNERGSAAYGTAAAEPLDAWLRASP